MEPTELQPLTEGDEDIDTMVRLVFDAMKPRYAHELKPVVMEDNIWVSVVDNEYIIQQ